MIRKGRTSRTPRTKEMLLPLPAGVARKISLENHLALATIRTGHGTPDAMIALLRVLYMTYFMLEKDVSDADLESFRDVETALDESIRAADGGGDWRVRGERLPAIERMLLQFDHLIARVQRYRYADAWARMENFARSPEESPLPGSSLNGIWE
ncbi:hypothetical protein [Burkholderia ubonensis]|uniref:hypothetical protein n=1 Tax=Burkholderia ubonensis TaxID=101571 RepID=UPI000AE40F05|nr:hypothetical protein [Burkholderia ubonensis]